MNPNRIVAQPRLGIFNVAALTEELGVSPRTIRRWTRQGTLPEPQRLGRSCYWQVEELREVLTRGRSAR